MKNLQKEDNQLYSLMEEESQMSKDRCSSECKDEDKNSNSDIASDYTGTSRQDKMTPRDTPSPSTEKV